MAELLVISKLSEQAKKQTIHGLAKDSKHGFTFTFEVYDSAIHVHHYFTAVNGWWLLYDNGWMDGNKPMKPQQFAVVYKDEGEYANQLHCAFDAPIEDIIDIIEKEWPGKFTIRTMFYIPLLNHLAIPNMYELLDINCTIKRKDVDEYALSNKP